MREVLSLVLTPGSFFSVEDPATAARFDGPGLQKWLLAALDTEKHLQCLALVLRLIYSLVLPLPQVH